MKLLHYSCTLDTENKAKNRKCILLWMQKKIYILSRLNTVKHAQNI